MRVALVFGAAILAATSAQAQQDLNNVATIGAIDGECVDYRIGTEGYGCGGLMYVNYKRGRTGYMIPTTNGGSILLSGGSDSQLNPEKYILNIDRISISHARNVPAQSYKATGRCVSVITADGKYVRTLDCDATNGTEAVVLRFKGANQPVALKHFR